MFPALKIIPKELDKKQKETRTLNEPARRTIPPLVLGFGAELRLNSDEIREIL
jgi:hypothetical protein